MGLCQRCSQDHVETRPVDADERTYELCDSCAWNVTHVIFWRWLYRHGRLDEDEMVLAAGKTT